ncbi:helix-turn-helix domain-containing protein [Actinokineospora sp. 24-640]
MTDIGGVSAGGDPTLAAKLNTLFASIRPDAERQYTNKEVAAAVGCTPVMIGYLRSGQRSNPSINLLRSLEAFFGVPHGYLYLDDPGLTRRVDDQLAMLERMTDSGVLRIAQRASMVSAEGLAAVTKMLDAVIELERARGERDA